MADTLSERFPGVFSFRNPCGAADDDDVIFMLYRMVEFIGRVPVCHFTSESTGFGGVFLDDIKDPLATLPSSVSVMGGGEVR